MKRIPSEWKITLAIAAVALALFLAFPKQYKARPGQQIIDVSCVGYHGRAVDVAISMSADMPGWVVTEAGGKRVRVTPDMGCEFGATR